MSDMDPSIIEEFLTESYENLDRLDRDFVELEKNPEQPDRLASVFRTIHTIKGTSGFLGFSKLEKLTHIGENVLSKLRDGVLKLKPDITSALLAMVDGVRTILDHIKENQTEGSEDYTERQNKLSSYLAPPGEVTTKPAAAKTTAPVPPKPAAKPAPAQPPAVTPPPVTAAKPNPEALPPAPQTTPEPAKPALEAAKPVENPTTPNAEPDASESIRVNVKLLDMLMNLVGELVLVRNQVLQHTTTTEDSNMVAATQRLNLVTTELQERVMKTRMQPIGNIWNKFPRMVRDLAIACRKDVQIAMDGKDTELDKTLIEAIKDPLTHLVRNVVDHGIEPAEKRQALGKPASGTLGMKAYHEGGQVIIEISDDGGGINIEKVKAKALEKGLVNPDQVARMSERDVVNLIFLPGFSTADQVTNVSGRGVGMDVVKTNIERIGGNVEIQSRLGLGTTFKIKIPLTLAIIPALMVSSGMDRYAIPQVNLLELVRLEGEEAHKGIELIHGAPVYRLRGKLLPLVNLRHELGGGAETETPKVVNLVVLQVDNSAFGLIVDEINDTEEIVVKPLGKELRGISIFAGATIMGDGTVALILDALGLAQKASLSSTSAAAHEAASLKHTLKTDTTNKTRERLLLFDLGDGSQKAIPLEAVDRLEEFAASSLERASGHEVVQYRGTIMPLLRMSDLLGEGQTAADEKLRVVVYTRNRKSVGLVVSHIHDILETEFTMQKTNPKAGILGSALIQGKVTDLVDLDNLVREAYPPIEEAVAA